MDARRTVELEGYTYEDLTDEHKSVMNWLNWFKDDAVGYLEDEYAEDPEDGVLAKAAKEIVSDVIEDFKEWLEIKLAETQIGLIESQQDV